MGNCAIVYESDEELGTLPALNTTNVEADLPSTHVVLTKLSHFTTDEKRQFLSVLDDFADVFIANPGLSKVRMHIIYVTPDFKSKPLKAYKVPNLFKPEVARQVQELLDLGVIQSSDSEMASPIVCVLKGRQGENGVCLCCDYCYLNKYTRADSFPTPDIADVIIIIIIIKEQIKVT